WAKAMLSWEESLKRISLLDIDWILDGHEPVHGLPLTRDRLDRSIASFGKMLNPWFTLNDTSEDDAEPVPAAVGHGGGGRTGEVPAPVCDPRSRADSDLPVDRAGIAA